MDAQTAATQAWHYAQQWRAIAALQWGPQRDEALRNALAWEYEYYRLHGVQPPALAYPPVGYPAASAPGTPQPGAPAAPADGYPTGPYAPSGYPAVGWGSPSPTPAPTWPAAPAWEQPQYQQAPYQQGQYQPLAYQPASPPRPRHSTGKVVAAVIVIVAMVVVLVVANRPRVSAGDVGLVTGPPATITVPTPTDSRSPARTSGLFAEESEADWKAGRGLEPLPSSVNQQPTVPFSPQYPDVNDWLRSQNPDQVVTAVFTDDPAYNCGLDGGDGEGTDSYMFAGCQDPSYGPVIFVYWGERTTVAEREFVVAHELSHYYQWYYYYDVNASASAQGFDARDAWVQDVETDATCRVLSWGGYSKDVADDTSSPCDVDDWYEGWLTQRATDLGVRIDDY